MPHVQKKDREAVESTAAPTAPDISTLTLDDTATVDPNNSNANNNDDNETPSPAAENPSAISNPKSKKKKKKSSAATAILSDPAIDYVALMSAFPVTLRTTNAKGRHSVARDPLLAGTTVCLERATAFIVRSPHLAEMCHRCLDPLENDNSESVTSRFLCEECNVAVYCSRGCMKDDALDEHGITCTTLGKLKEVAGRTNVDVDLLRMVVGLMARRWLDLKREEQNEGEDGKDGKAVDLGKTPTPYKCVNDLIHHKDRSDVEFIKVVTTAAEALHEIMPKELLMPVIDIVTLACKVNTNAHGLGDSHSRNKDVALGLFPMGALFFNHSCAPNCCFVGQRHGCLAFRTLRPVARDEELTVSYIDLYASRDERRTSLQLTKHFWCKCRRCVGPIEKSIDRHLSGLLCAQCRKGTHVIPPSPTPESLTNPPPPEQLESRIYPCDTCNHVLPHTDAFSIISQATQEYNNAISLIQLRRYSDARVALSRLLRTHELSPSTTGTTILHPHHALLLNTSVPLMNCHVYARDHAAAAALNRAVLKVVQESGAFPPNAPELSDYWFNLGELMAEQAARGGRLVQKKCEKEARQAFKECWEIRKVAFGEQHVKTRAAARGMGGK